MSSRSSSSKKRNRKNPFQGIRSRLQVERLEDRALMSTVPTISGFVYADANNNGAFDSGEKPIANSQIVLINNSNNQVVGTTTTAADGSYSFTTDSSVPGPEQNTATQTITLGPTLTNFQDPGALPQFNSSLGTLDKVVITESGTILSDIQAENTSPVADTITGIVSGTFSLSAPGVSNDSLTVTGQTNTFSATANPSDDKSFTGTSSVTWDDVSATSTTPNTITVSDPNALADYIGTGTVAVTETGNATSSATDTTGNITTNIVSHGQATLTVTYYYHSSGPIQYNTSYTVEQPNVPAGYIPGLNSKNGTILTYNATPPEEITDIVVTPQVPLAPNNNFGELKTTSISGTAYVQTTPNQVYTQGTTPPLAGVTMTLAGGTLTKPLTTTTAQDGSYSFTNLTPGNYTVTQTQPTEYLPGTITAGSDGGQVGSETVAQIGLNSGDMATGYNFGELSQPSIAGVVYVEPDAPTQTLYQNEASTPGISGVTVTLTGSNGSMKTTTTAADGTYSFNDLTVGVTYDVKITHPTGYLVGTDTAGSSGGQVSTTSEDISQVVLAGGIPATGYDFGELLPSSLSGNVYVDAKNDGQLDPGDPPIAGDKITLTGFSDQGPVSETTTTKADGSYSFTNLRPGTYAITQTQPASYTAAATTVGSQGGTGATNNISAISLGADVTGVSNNFGELKLTTTNQGNPLPIPPDPIPIISKSQLLSDTTAAYLPPQVSGQMAFVLQATNTLTGSFPSAQATTAAVQQLNSGLSDSAFISQLWNSTPHFTQAVNSLYNTLLKRGPTSQELAAGLAILQSGGTLMTVEQSILVSPAYEALHPTSQDLVTALYQNVLNETPGSVDSQNLLQSLGTEPLSTVVNNLLTSSTSLAKLLSVTYEQTLHRMPTASEIQSWTTQLQAGNVTIDEIAQQLLASQEFYQLALNTLT